jgi:hypothetical protein
MHRSARTLTAALFVMCGTLAYPGCTPERPPLPTAISADAGDYSFVRQAMPILLGRKTKGHAEVMLLADVIAATDRGTVVRALMDQPEFIDHWAEHFVDRLRVHRETRKLHDLCYGDPMRTTSDSGSTARIILNRPASSGPIVGAPSFNMTDLIRSSLEADNLSVIYRAHLFALLDKPSTGNEITEQNVRDDFGATFGNTYINRQIGCLLCHNSEFSRSGEYSGWDRSHPIPGTFERSLFSSSFGRDHQEVHALFRSANVNAPPVTDPETPADSPDPSAQTILPWGMQRCGEFKLTVPDDPLGKQAYLVRNYGLQGGIFDLEESLWNGVNFLNVNGLNRVGSALTNDDAAFAFLVAANIVDETWTAVMGYPLTIPINLPRNPDQQAVLWNMSEGLFIRIHWSLKYVLRRILTSEYFNRLPPVAFANVLPSPGEPDLTPFDMPILFDPWNEADPRCPPEALPNPGSATGCWPTQPQSDPAHSVGDDPERHFNAMTESIHRYSPRSLLNSVSAALDWPVPTRFPGEDYPHSALVKAIGGFATDAQPGFDSVDFQGLLHWEWLHGACDKAGKQSGDDWIDRLVATVPAFDAAHPGSPATLRDAVVTIKDWLLGDSRIDALSETPALETILGAPLNTVAASMTPADLSIRLRRVCGVMLETPQFMLAGIAPRELGAAPRLRVCNGAPCSYREMCEQLRPAVESQNWLMTCNDESVTVHRPPPPPPPTLDPLCPRGPCMTFPVDVRLECFADGKGCPRFPPPCDIRCAGLQCCGDPDPLLGEEGILLGWAEGGTVNSAAGVRTLPAGSDSFQELEANTILKFGDLLLIPPGARLDIRSSEGSFRTDQEGAPKTASGNPLLFMVTGPTAIEPRLQRFREPDISKEELDRISRPPYQRWGEAGRIPDLDGTAPAGRPHERKPLEPQ